MLQVNAIARLQRVTLDVKHVRWVMITAIMFRSSNFNCIKTIMWLNCASTKLTSNEFLPPVVILSELLTVNCRNSGSQRYLMFARCQCLLRSGIMKKMYTLILSRIMCKSKCELQYRYQWPQSMHNLSENEICRHIIHNDSYLFASIFASIQWYMLVSLAIMRSQTVEMECVFASHSIEPNELIKSNEWVHLLHFIFFSWWPIPFVFLHLNWCEYLLQLLCSNYNYFMELHKTISNDSFAADEINMCLQVFFALL